MKVENTYFYFHLDFAYILISRVERFGRPIVR